MTRGDFVFHKALGLCCLVDYADKEEKVAIVAHEAEPGTLKFAIASATDVVQIAVPPLVDAFQRFLAGRGPTT